MEIAYMLQKQRASVMPTVLLRLQHLEVGLFLLYDIGIQVDVIALLPSLAPDLRFAMCSEWSLC